MPDPSISQNGFEKFDAYTTAIAGKNLVEASAGTGKTFSIGILALRLILEQPVSIKEILLVTFTNNAVSELEERIRLFIKLAHDYLVSGKAPPAHIRQVIENCIERGIQPSELQQKLKDAMLFLDELSVMTIHSFCLQSLTNQSFETGQLFGGELISSLDDIYLRYIRNFWRKHITTLPLSLYEILMAEGYSRETILKILKEHAAGKHYFYYDPGQQYTFDASAIDTALIISQNLNHQIQTLKDQYTQVIIHNRQAIEEKLKTNRYARKAFIEDGLLDDPEKILNTLSTDNPKGYYQLLDDWDINKLAQQWKELHTKAMLNSSALVQQLNCFAIREVGQDISQHLSSGGILSYNELITNLHTAITGANKETICSQLRTQYKAVFIDEFQDTDRKQYEIFTTAFGDDTILFFIGDPKQSIYAWRQADIYTYFEARHYVDHCYSMNTNYRSTPDLIRAMNRFFLPTPDFDTFHFGTQQESVKYLPVDAPAQSDKGVLHYDGKPLTPMQIFKAGNWNIIQQETGRLILQLLTDEKFRIVRNGQQYRIYPRDIGILVRSKKHGQAIKDRLNEINLPSVFISDQTIMQTEEAKGMLLLLKAIFNPDIRLIQTALTATFTGLSSSEILKLNNENLVTLFKEYKSKWEARGVNVALSAFLTDFGIRTYLTNPDTSNGLRIITNVNQLTELLFRTEYQKRLKQLELIDWMQRATEMELIEEDDKLIRLENDSDAVTISTIHSAKGLQYPIVIATQLDMDTSLRNGYTSLYIREDIADQAFEPFRRKYVYIPVADLERKGLTQIAEEQLEQENRRLLYVAVTRAVYGCFIFKNTYKLYNNTGLAHITDKLQALEEDLPENLIRISEVEEINALFQITSAPYRAQNANNPIPARVDDKLKIKDYNWQFMSYSGLTEKSEVAPPQIEELASAPDEYDTFVFERLKRGPVTGTMIHEIFEKIDFTDNQRHDYIIANVVQHYTSSGRDDYRKFLPVLIHHVLHAVIPANGHPFLLKDVKSSQRARELEFDFSINRLQPMAIREYGVKVMDKIIRLRTDFTMKGMMNGFIDLFFEHEGRYYVLDWKTNFLGNKVSHYTGESLEQAMDEWNYHLQYLIYTLAVKKYLKLRLGTFDYNTFGGVIYCFVRGMRAGEDAGIYCYRPKEEDLELLEAVIK